MKTDTARNLDLLDSKIEEACNGGGPADLALWRETTEVVLRHIFGDLHPIYKKFRGVSYTPGLYVGGVDMNPAKAKAVRSGISKAIAILRSAKTEVELSDERSSSTASSTTTGTTTFIVHGHNDGVKYELARFLRRLTGNEPVILHEQPNRGMTLLDKFEAAAANAAFVVVIATADDVGRAVGAADDRPRARQNVIFELGYFFGTVGRDKVVLLFEPGVEAPSDIDGLAHVEIDPAGGWKNQLARDMSAAGVRVDFSALG